MRLGLGRIHHCMRSIGVAERALEMMIRRSTTRHAFGKPIIQLGKNIELFTARAHRLPPNGPPGRQSYGHAWQQGSTCLCQRH